MQKSVLHECQKLSTFDHVGREFLMLDGHGTDHLTESVMLGSAFQTSWAMKNLHDKFTLFQTQTLLHLISGLRYSRPVVQRNNHMTVKKAPSPY